MPRGPPSTIGRSRPRTTTRAKIARAGAHVAVAEASPSRRFTEWRWRQAGATMAHRAEPRRVGRVAASARGCRRSRPRAPRRAAAKAARQARALWTMAVYPADNPYSQRKGIDPRDTLRQIEVSKAAPHWDTGPAPRRNLPAPSRGADQGGHHARQRAVDRPLAINISWQAASSAAVIGPRAMPEATASAFWC